MPLFSVVVPTFNRADLILNALSSVRQQECRDFELIVVDDGSNDHTPEVVRAWDGSIVVLEKERGGPGSARNVGAKAARGEYIAFLDSDDVWFPWTLSTFAALVHRHKYPSIMSSKLIQFLNWQELSEVKRGTIEVEHFHDYLASAGRGHFVGAGMAVLRRDEFIKAGGYTERPINLEDHDLILRMGISPGFVQIVHPTTMGWRRHAGSATTSISKSVIGARYLLEQELSGVYPGGRARARERQLIVSAHVRAVSLECLRDGMHREGRQLYRATLGWHLSERRWRYLAGFVLRDCLS